MYINFRVMKKGELEIVANDSVSISDAPLTGDAQADPRGTLKSVDITDHFEEMTTLRMMQDGSEQRVFDFDKYFQSGWSGRVYHTFNREKYLKGEFPFDSVSDPDNEYQFIAHKRREKIRNKIDTNISVDSQIKILRKALTELFEKTGNMPPEALTKLTETIDAIKGNNPKGIESASANSV